MPLKMSDYEIDPMGERLVIGLYGKPGCGKSSAILDLVRAKQYVTIISLDEGLIQLHRNWPKYRKYFDVIYPKRMGADDRPETFDLLQSIFASVRMAEARAINLINRGCPAKRIWTFLDTATHLQGLLLQEGKRFEEQVISGNTKGRRTDVPFLAKIDFNQNAGIMTEISNMILRIPGNIVMSFQQGEDKSYVNTTYYIPKLQGASYQMWVGDLDVLLYLRVNGDKSRTFCTKPATTYYAKDRLDVLPDEILLVVGDEFGSQPTLQYIRDLYYPPAVKAAPAVVTVTPDGQTELPTQGE